MAPEQAGEFPYTRGIAAEPKPWIMGQYAGFGTPAQSNERFRRLLAEGVTGFSVALDLPTQLGIDSDDPRAAGEVGRVGVAIDSLADIEILMSGIPLEKISQVRTTANSIGYLWTALFTALAENRGVHPDEFGLFIQNDVLKEFIARGTQIFPPGPSLKLAVDTIEHCVRHTPRWVPLAMSGYHIREAGSDAAQEIGYTFANAIAYLDECVRRGLSVDAVAPTLFTFLSVNMDVLGEIAKLRAARRVWATLVRERYGTKDPRSEQLRIFAFTAGSSLTAQQPLNNVVRATAEMIAAALGGIQTMHVSAYDEALGVPTEAAATLALRTQQIVAFETGLGDVVDPLGGAPYIEARTDAMEREIRDVMAAVAERGGALACIESGYLVGELSEAAYRQAQAVESGTKPVVGVNLYPSATGSLDVFTVDPSVEAAQVTSVRALKAKRGPIDAVLADVRAAAVAGDNVIPACTAAVRAYATIGEIVTELRKVYGNWQATGIF
ncbi:acyl-CoA mutase large subunit family protein [Longispora albida]|uniref:acyl-CoA mutase large subunit family protein n=1 Tax=Longispora albida TaxID=203523 RepID=UPI00036E80AF|nr:methylmalonyl-CoA mutase family protein [Longispora albida]